MRSTFAMLRSFIVFVIANAAIHLLYLIKQ